MDIQKINTILDNYLQGKAPVREEQRVEKWLETIGEEQNQWTAMPEHKQQIFLQDLFEDITIHSIQPAKIVPLHRSTWKRYAAAAAIIFAIALGAYWWLTPEKQQPTLVATRPATDVKAPATTKATITLADGRTISLDSLNTGLLAQEGDVTVVKNALGEIVYDAAEHKSAELTYHTLVNPRGSKVVTLALPDGSRVWLNTASSIRYPTAFAGNERAVEVTGEAYFEVTKNASKKFIVHAGGVQTEVLGTHFNVNAFDDEAETKITLLEGRVKVSVTQPETVSHRPSLKQPRTGKPETFLTPGQQALITPGGPTTNYKLQTSNSVDLEAVMAWKNGFFHFSNASLQEVMRQITRWYDVDVEYQGTIPPRRFGGEISRNANLSEVLKILEESKVHFTLENKKLTVKP
jgi:transmembrane sensor